MPLPALIIFVGLSLMLTPVLSAALRPAYPHNRVIAALWWATLALAAGLYVWIDYLTPRLLHEPRWYTAAGGMFLVGVPFAISHLLARWRLKNPAELAGWLAATITVGASIAVFFAYNTFNQSCVFYDVYHDQGQAWCPASWQAR